MNTPTITMEREAALLKLESYEEAARKNPRAFAELDRGIMQGYRVLAKGGRLVDVNEAIKNGGLNLAGFPKLAIARAHAQVTHWQCAREIRWGDNNHFQVRTGGGTYDYRVGQRWNIDDDRVKWTLPRESFDATKLSEKSVQAYAPLIPLPLRPKFKLENYFVLWEANWHPAPPRDPYLLKPLAGALMEIIAEWDLTDLEVAAVRGAMQR